jgi:hypothetical protein
VTPKQTWQWRWHKQFKLTATPQSRRNQIPHKRPEAAMFQVVFFLTGQTDRTLQTGGASKNLNIKRKNIVNFQSALVIRQFTPPHTTKMKLENKKLH